MKVGEFLFTIGFGKPDTRNLVRAENEAKRAVRAAQKAVADGAEDAAEKVEEAAKAVAKHGRQSKKEITGWGKALHDVGKEAKKAASDFTAAWREPKALAEAWGKALGRAKTAVLGVGGAAAGAAVGLGALIHSTTESDAELTRWATRLGMSVGELSKLEQAAAGFAEADDVREGIQTLRENLAELANEGTGPALESLRDLGIAVGDIQGQEATVQLEMLADALGGVDNETGIKAMLELLGGEGGKLLPFLRQGADGMAALAAEAEALGLVVDDGAAEASAKLGREIGQVIAMAKALAADIARGLMPEIKKYVGIAKEWAKQNSAIVKSKIREFVAELIPKLVELVGTISSIVSAGAGLVDSLGGMGNALMIAAGAFTALQVAALGIPGVILAASAALAIGINELAGYRQEAERLRKETRALDRSVSLLDRAKAGDLDSLTDEQFRAEAEATLQGASVEDWDTLSKNIGIASDQRRRSQGIEAAAEAEVKRSESDAAARVKVIEVALRKRAKKKGLGESAVQTALAKAKQSLREGQSWRSAGDIAADALDGLATSPGAGGKDKVDTRAARDLFGDDLDRIAKRDGAGSAAVNDALKAAAESLKGGSTEGVARAAAYSRLGQATGREYKTLGDGKDPLLSTLLGKDVPDMEMSKLALGASPSVLQVTITNNIDARSTITIPGAAGPAATGGAVADHIHGLFGSVAKMHKLAKVVFQR
jgi:hypothetical protein